MSVLIDTNVLLRRIQPDHAHHALAIDSVARLLATGEQVYFTLQNISEFWNVMTRPIAANGLGSPRPLPRAKWLSSRRCLPACQILRRLTRNGSASSTPMPSAARRCTTRGLWLS